MGSSVAPRSRGLGEAQSALMKYHRLDSQCGEEGVGGNRMRRFGRSI
jgi:hypothetical protein